MLANMVFMRYHSIRQSETHPGSLAKKLLSCLVYEGATLAENCYDQHSGLAALYKCKHEIPPFFSALPTTIEKKNNSHPCFVCRLCEIGYAVVCSDLIV